MHYIRDGSIITSDRPKKSEQNPDTLKALRHLIAFRDKHPLEPHDGQIQNKLSGN